jgi:multidrug resistance efflux pump
MLSQAEATAAQAEATAAQAAATAAQAEASAAQAEAMLTRSEVRYLQTALLRLAGRRFGQVSENVARRVEATQDMSQLNSWFDQIADAGSLEETELGSQG